jgi:adenylyltransferase/sulfurtransferase
MLNPAELARYSRQIRLEELGSAGQERLSSSRVLVAGLGGLGGPAALYLAAAGVGTLGLADFDLVEEHNLHRQILFDSGSVGSPKVAAAAARLRAANPLVRVVGHPEGVTPANAIALFSSYDVIVDGTDTFSSRYLNNDAAVLSGRPLVHGSVFKFQGQVTVFDTSKGGPCHRCLHPEPPPPASVPSCGDAGVLGALCGVIGSFQALEALKLACGLGEPLRGIMLVIDALGNGLHSFRFARNPGCPVCGGNPSILSLGQPAATADPAEPMAQAAAYPIEIPVEEARRLVDAEPEGTLIVDVREPHEFEICSIAGSELIPLGQLPGRARSLPSGRRLLLLCHHGRRSMAATEFLRAHGHGSASSVAGGIDAWARRIDPGMRKY